MLDSREYVDCQPTMGATGPSFKKFLEVLDEKDRETTTGFCDRRRGVQVWYLVNFALYWEEYIV